MKQEPTSFDLAIIGGGIAGAAIARDATFRGFRVVLFEKETLGSGTSSRSSKLIHGGLRYLETAWIALKIKRFGESLKNLRFVCSSLKEGQILERIAPELVRPIEFIIPIYKADDRTPLAIFLGAWVYGVLGRLYGNPKSPKIFRSKDTVLKRIPYLNPKGLLGGVSIWDRITDDRELVRATARSAETHGAKIYEYSLVKHYQYLAAEKQFEIEVESTSQGHCRYTAKKLINASGPWVDQVRNANSRINEEYLVPVAGVHITLKKFTDYSVILRTTDKRIFFIVNQGSLARIGTTERIHKDPDTVEPLDEEVEYLLTALERYFPQIPFNQDEIISKDAAVRPLAKPQRETEPHNISREHEVRIDSSGVLHVLGVKMTDHRRAAQEIVDRIVRELKPVCPNLKTHSSTHLHRLS